MFPPKPRDNSRPFLVFSPYIFLFPKYTLLSDPPLLFLHCPYGRVLVSFRLRYVYPLTTAGCLGDQTKCEDESKLNQIKSVSRSTTLLWLFTSASVNVPTAPFSPSVRPAKYHSLIPRVFPLHRCTAEVTPALSKKQKIRTSTTGSRSPPF